MIQSHKLQENNFRGKQFRDHDRELRGNNDLLNLTAPQIIVDIHKGFLKAGAGIITTNTFNSTAIAQKDYALSHLAYDLNLAGARLARRSARLHSEDNFRVLVLLLEHLEKVLPEGVPLTVLPYHINDERFASEIVKQIIAFRNQ